MIENRKGNIMSLIVKERGGAEKEPIPTGAYVAVCYGIIDLGTHPNPTFGNEAHKVLVQWEIPEVRGEFERDGQKVSLPRAISKRYTLSLNEKANLRKDLESWRGRRFTSQELSGFDLKAILGTSCQIQIVHETGKTDGRTFAAVGAIMALPRGLKSPKPENPLVFFSFEDAGAKPELPPDLPEWVSKIVMESREWRESGAMPAIAIPSQVPATADVGAAVESGGIPF